MVVTAIATTNQASVSNASTDAASYQDGELSNSVRRPVPPRPTAKSSRSELVRSGASKPHDAEVFQRQGCEAAVMPRHGTTAVLRGQAANAWSALQGAGAATVAWAGGLAVAARAGRPRDGERRAPRPADRLIGDVRPRSARRELDGTPVVDPESPRPRSRTRRPRPRAGRARGPSASRRSCARYRTAARRQRLSARRHARRGDRHRSHGGCRPHALRGRGPGPGGGRRTGKGPADRCSCARVDATGTVRRVGRTCASHASARAAARGCAPAAASGCALA
jgi:hypothetical protein